MKRKSLKKVVLLLIILIVLCLFFVFAYRNNSSMKTILPHKPTSINISNMSKTVIVTEMKDIDYIITTLENNIQVTFAGIGEGPINGFAYIIEVNNASYVFHEEYLMKAFIQYEITESSNIEEVDKVIEEMIEKYSK